VIGNRRHRQAARPRRSGRLPSRLELAERSLLEVLIDLIGLGKTGGLHSAAPNRSPPLRFICLDHCQDSRLPVVDVASGSSRSRNHKSADVDRDDGRGNKKPHVWREPGSNHRGRLAARLGRQAAGRLASWEGSGVNSPHPWETSMSLAPFALVEERPCRSMLGRCLVGRVWRPDLGGPGGWWPLRQDGVST